MRGGGLIIILLLLLVVVALAGTAVLQPLRLGFVQEQVLGLVHGGIVGEQQETFVENCLQIEGQEGLRAVQRTRRRVFFADGTSLEIIYSEPPTISNANC